MPLLRGIARTAAIAGTATAVSNRVSRRQQNRWAQQEDQQYAQQQPQQYAAARPRGRGAGEGSGGTAQRSRRAQVAGDPHRCRVRRPEGEDPGVLNIGPATAQPSSPVSRRHRECHLAAAAYASGQAIEDRGKSEHTSLSCSPMWGSRPLG